ncbi:MAG TPA: 30S ribosome-binding factor RbfA [Chloroflexi bacterium]|nr:30S ribosome-binding factor RbfA [Chloroflexota bacterium]
MVSQLRLRRINERLKEELALLLLYEVADPRVRGASVTDVRVDRELAYADVFVSAVEGSERREEILEGLEHARGFLSRELARRVELRQFPRLRFHWDPTPERAERIEALLEQIRAEREARGEQAPTEADDDAA